MKFIGIIPARYASTRFPGKPLAMLDGKPVIQHVYEKVASCLEAAYVATDDERIFNAVEAFGGKAVMTRKDHKSGTDRIEEAIEKIGGDWDVIVNVQGDEPFVDKSQLETICQCFDDPTTQIATLEWLKSFPYLKHLGIYAYRKEVLKEVTKLPQSSLEIAESLEQLRWLQNGYKIKVGTTDVETVGIDTPEDLQRAEEFLKNGK